MPPTRGDIGRFSVEVQGRGLAGPEGVARHITQRFMAEVASGPRIREEHNISLDRAALVRNEL